MQENIGRIFITTLTSSTCCTVHSREEWTCLFTTALLRKLKLFVKVSVPGAISLEFSFDSSLAWVGLIGLALRFAMALLGVLLMKVVIAATIRTCSKKKVVNYMKKIMKIYTAVQRGSQKVHEKPVVYLENGCEGTSRRDLIPVSG